MMPSCACKVALEKKAYLIGVLAPFVVLGLGSILFVFVYPGTVSLLTMMVNFVAAGADLLIALHVLREENCCSMQFQYKRSRRLSERLRLHI